MLTMDYSVKHHITTYNIVLESIIVSSCALYYIVGIYSVFQ